MIGKKMKNDLETKIIFNENFVLLSLKKRILFLIINSLVIFILETLTTFI